jgi:hypothetical protein
MSTPRSDVNSPEIRALDQQIMQAEAAGRWQQAAQLLRTRAQRVAPLPEQVRSLEHLASLLRVKLGDERGAMQVAEELLAIDATHAAARQYLIEGYTRLGNSARAQQLRAGAPSGGPSGGGMLGAIQGALGSAVSAVGVAAAGFANAVEASNRDPAWMRAQGKSTVPSPPAASRQTRCPYCGTDLVPGATSCSQCGASL